MSTASAPARTPWLRAIALGVGLSLIVGGILLAFAWPSLTASAEDLPVGIVGPDASVAQVEEAVDEKADGAVELIRYDDRDAAVTAIEHREAYGEIVLGDAPTDAPEVLKATAASTQVAGVLDGLAAQLQKQIDAQIRIQVEQGVQQLQATMGAALQAAMAGQRPQLPQTPETFEIPTVTVVVTDLAPYSDADPQGVGLTVSIFPLVIGGVLGGVLLSLTVTGVWRRLVGVLVYSASAGLVLTGILQTWVGALQADFWADAAAIALTIAAIASTVTALSGLFGRPGVAVGAVSMILFANPLSAANVPVEFLLEPWGTIGQWMPPGAGATLLRELSYFPDADVSQQWLLLGGWALGGLVLTALDPAGRRAARTAAAAGPEPASAPVAPPAVPASV
ncbi:hypothetical protein L2X99_17370 [Microbacterium sp. KUDC0406]|uniref:hypothetical protein n=1 Tax=Microbacterium sp. KUDC0406 TaxID=2909588 RepID=UPI001F392663|nr:hypothetical protein [Microbacterium sp. KUDC0406]UJP10095.1 hypothetical protein L2X99_17370 [Microbacterium sp. KUDC0406]